MQAGFAGKARRISQRHHAPFRGDLQGHRQTSLFQHHPVFSDQSSPQYIALSEKNIFSETSGVG